MRTSIKVLLATGAVAVVAAGVAHAQGYRWSDLRDGRMGPGMRVERVFNMLDADKDGAVTLAEALKGVDARFELMDTNKDGFVDAAELRAALADRAPRLGMKRGEQIITTVFSIFDADKDGKISKEQAEKPFGKLFALGDLNDDGKITKDEIGALAMLRPGPGMMGPGKHHGGPDGPRHGMMDDRGRAGPDGPGMRGPQEGWGRGGDHPRRPPPPPADPQHTMRDAGPGSAPQLGQSDEDQDLPPLQPANVGPFQWRTLGGERSTNPLDLIDFDD